MRTHKLNKKIGTTKNNVKTSQKKENSTLLKTKLSFWRQKFALKMNLKIYEQ